jgi:inorganic phosphate transporter, PiT family
VPEVPVLLIVIVGIALLFDYTNGVHDCANAVASTVSTKVLSPGTAVAMAAILNFVGALLGTKVAETVGKGIINPDMIMNSHSMILAALLGAICWNLFTWRLGLPSSSSHALIGGLMGAAVMANGRDVLQYRNILSRIVLPLVGSPLAGFLGGFLLMRLLARLTRHWRYQRADSLFRKLQIAASALMATSHGLNDAQKTMGLITLALIIFRQINLTDGVPLWVKLTCALCMGLGTLTGGWKIIRTMGMKIFKMRPVHGFASQAATAAVILSASAFGAPISTTQVVSSSVLGVGSSKRLRAVNWGVGIDLAIAWTLTIPASALVGASCQYLLHLCGVN